MKKNERFKKIEEFTSKVDAVTIDQLLKYIPVSESTIRRDIIELEERGLIVRRHGSISWQNSREKEQDFFLYRISENMEVKQKLAKKVASLIMDNEAVYLESGTTLFASVKYISAKNVTVVTSDIAIAAELAKMDNISTIILGGYVWRGSYVVTGDIAETNLQRMNFSKYFTSPGAIGHNGDLMYYTIQTTSLRDKAMAKASESIVVCDSSKFSRTGFITNGNLSQISILITDFLPDHIKILLTNKTTVILVNEND